MDVHTRLAFLERAVATLMARPPQSGRRSEALTANYLTVSPDGRVGADFTGRVSAQGLNLPAGSATPPALGAINAVEWLDGNTILADINAIKSTAGEDGVLLLEAWGGDNSGHTGIVLSVLTLLGAIRQQLQLLDDLGRSDFAQTNNPATTASAGARTLPANPAGFFTVTTTAGTTVKIPYYNP